MSSGNVFLYLTTADTEQPILINVRAIAAIRAGYQGSEIHLSPQPEDCYLVKESFEEACKALTNAIGREGIRTP